MTQKAFLLFGFACGRSEAPQFVEPVFLSDEKLWVQSASADSETVQEFVAYSEDIEILESSSYEMLHVGQARIFAIRDIGDRIICGNRDYVSKYLSQNLKKYLDKPYFLSDASRFSNKLLPDLYFIKNDTDLIQAAALAGSLRRFCEREILRSKTIISQDIEYDEVNLIDRGQLISKILAFESDKTIFERWLAFAETDSPRLAKYSEWRHIDRNYRSVFPESKKNVARYTFVYFKAAQFYIDKIISSDRSIVSSAYIKSPKSSNIEVHFESEFSNASLIRTTERLYLKEKQRDGFYRKNIANRIYEYIQRKISRGVETREISKIEISMSVYFLSLVIKFTLDKNDNR